MAVETIDDVIRALDGIIDWAWTERSRLGYFAALYARVTRAVKEGIAQSSNVRRVLDVLVQSKRAAAAAAG